MKKIFYSLAFVISAVSVNAQTEKGHIMVGSQFANIHVDETKFSAIATPGIAWFLSDDFALGARVGLGYEKPKGTDGTFIYGLSPMARLYFGGNEKNKFFGQINLGIGGTDGDNSTFWNAGAGVGYNYFINRNVALELGAGYDYTKEEGIDGLSSFDLNFGLQVFLPTKKVKK